MKKFLCRVSVLVMVLAMGISIAISLEVAAADRSDQYNANNPGVHLIRSDGTRSPHFTVNHVRCHHFGDSSACSTQVFTFDPRLVYVLDRVRAHFGRELQLNGWPGSPVWNLPPGTRYSSLARGFRCEHHARQWNIWFGPNEAHARGTGVDLSINGVSQVDLYRFVVTLPHVRRNSSGQNINRTPSNYTYAISGLNWIHIEVNPGPVVSAGSPSAPRSRTPVLSMEGISSGTFVFNNVGAPSRLLGVSTWGAPAARNNITIFDDVDNEPTQHWRLERRGNAFLFRPGASSLVMNAYRNNYAVAGTNVNVFNYHAGARTQLWVINPLGNGQFSIASQSSPNLVLTAAGTGNSARISMQPFTNTASQRWTIGMVGGASDTPTIQNNRVYRINSVGAGGRSLAPRTGSWGHSIPQSNQAVGLWNFRAGTTTFEWLADYVGGAFVMRANHNRNVILNAFAWHPTHGTNVNIHSDVNSATQQWIFEARNDGQFVIRNRFNNNLVLTATGTGEGSGVQVRNYVAGNAMQRWTLTLMP